MEATKKRKREIAESFSNGEFEVTFPHMLENIQWNVIGENVFKGKSDVIQNCVQIAEYFKSVQTQFETKDVVEAGNKVVVMGTGEFFREEVSINRIAACDVYEFDDEDNLKTISSYCISESK
ncbi:hypothetical protein [Neolewinella persica]|uniref:hypothetical protein n=1 Tax=Neolewinella persica TaxID=70998 RepID=UPI00037A31CB|nr:hypothetical protein [Neolewinella persica]